MGFLVKIIDQFNLIIADIPEIKQHIFDDLSAANADSQADYPLLLSKPPVSEGTKEDRSMEYSICSMDMFMFKPEMSGDEAHWTEASDECHDLMTQFLRKLFLLAPDYVLIGSVQTTPFHMEHNARLVGVRVQFKMRVHNGC